MTESMPLAFTREELNRLQQLRSAVFDFQNSIAPLAAELRSEAHSEQFNQLRLETKALLRDSNFDETVPRAVTEEMWTTRSQKVVLPRLTIISFLGVILALVGLGINSIILEDVLVNSLGCCVSSSGMLLLVGAFGVWGVVNSRRRLSNLGDLYVLSDMLLEQIDQTLNTAVPSRVERQAADSSEVPSVVELTLDSLQKQAADWLQKLGALKNQQLALGASAPLELSANIDFAWQELNQVKQKIARLQGTETAKKEVTSSPVPPGARVIVPTGAPSAPQVRAEPADASAVRRARSDTLDMPVLPPEEEANPMDEVTPLFRPDETENHIE